MQNTTNTDNAGLPGSPAANTAAVLRRNHRTGDFVHLVATDGVPACPHCSAPMTRVGATYENSFCPCWWRGAADASYGLQVVVTAAQADEDAEEAAREAAAAPLREAQAVAEAKASFEGHVHHYAYIRANSLFHGRSNSAARCEHAEALKKDAAFRAEQLEHFRKDWPWMAARIS